MEPMFRWLKRLVVIVPVLVALFFAGVFIYANVINKADPKLTTDDLRDALTTTIATTPAAGAPDGSAITPTGSTVSAAGDTAAPTGVSAAPSSAAGFDGTWSATDASELGYRVEEVLTGVNTTATGRTNAVTGTLTLSGTTVTAVDVSVEVARITSDQNRRDAQFKGRIMEADRYPTATFVLTAPIELGSLPVGDEQVTASATGDLTLHGVTRSVTFELTAQVTNDQIGVLGNIPVTFADYGIANPSNNFVKMEDQGLIEFVLVFART